MRRAASAYRVSYEFFEGRLRRAPQDEVTPRMPSNLFLMLRCGAPSRRRLRRLLRTRRRLELRAATGLGMCLAATVVLLLTSAPVWAQSCQVDFAPGQETVALRDVQEQLKAQGFNPGPVDGVLGPKTCDAVRAYQKAAGLRIDGMIDPKLQNYMHFIAKKGA